MKQEKLNSDKKVVEQQSETDNKRGTMDLKHKLGNILIAAGIIIICIPFIGRYIADKEQERMLKEFYESYPQLSEEGEKLNTVLGYTDDETLQKDLDKSAKAIAEISLNEGLSTDNVAKISTGPTAVGIINIPKIKLKYPIAEGVDDATLRFCIGHMPNTADLGEIGNSVLAGHRSHSFGSFFNRLDELEVNDIITIQTKDYSTNYKVYEKKRVHKTDLSVLNQNENQKELTLITCELGVNPEKRIIVKARAEEQENSEIEEQTK